VSVAAEATRRPAATLKSVLWDAKPSLKCYRGRALLRLERARFQLSQTFPLGKGVCFNRVPAKFSMLDEPREKCITRDRQP
jgi:hypothetical protein